VDDLADAALFCLSAGSRRSPRPIPIRCQFLKRGHRPGSCRSGSLPALVAKPVGYEGEIPLRTRASPGWHPEKTTSDVSKAGGPSAGRPRIPLAKACRPDRPGLCPQGWPPTPAIRSPLNLASWPSIEGLISAIQVATNGRRTAMDCFCFFVEPHRFKNPTSSPWPAGWLRQRFQPLLTSPRFQPTPKQILPDNGVDAQRFVLLLTVARCAVGARHGRVMARLRAVRSTHRFAAMRSAATRASGSRHQGAVSASETREAAGAVSAGHQLPDPIRAITSSPLSSRSPRAPGQWFGDLHCFGQSQGTLARGGTLGR